MAAKPIKGDRIRNLFISLIVVSPIGGGLFYWGPTTPGVIPQACPAGKIGLVNHEVNLGNYRIHYMVAGQGKPLVLVHGLAGRAENWPALIPEFTKNGYKVYALDLLG